jgi:hypothetical protein
MIALFKVAALVIAPLPFIGTPDKSPPIMPAAVVAKAPSGAQGAFRVAQNPPVNDWTSGGVQHHPDYSGSAQYNRAIQAAPPPMPSVRSLPQASPPTDVYMQVPPPAATTASPPPPAKSR